jgi:hypothetical protein
VSTTAVVFIGLIAAATLVIAAVQVGLVVVVLRLGRQLEALGSRIEEDIQPLIVNATIVSANAARVSELAASQIERADHLFATVAGRIDDATRRIHGTLLAPAREGRALLAAIGAVIAAVRDGRHARSGSPVQVDDDDPLFIG